VNGLIEMWNMADLRFPRIDVPSWVPGIGGKGFGGFDVFPDISPLAAGGLVTAPTLALVGESGPELVIPLDRAGGVGSTIINVHVTGVSGEEVVDAIRRETQRRGAAVFPSVSTRRS